MSPQPAAAHLEPRPPPPEIRDVRFDLSEVPRYWHGGRRSVTLFFNNLSIFFPPGERFFVTSVKRYAGTIQDAALREEVRGFCGQEGHHTREHVRYNEMLVAQGYPVEAMEKRVENLLKRTAKVYSHLGQLAVTCALEHFTAMLASLVLEEPRALEGAHPQMAALWRWHAAEENEHKAVAFDVYRAVGGGWLRRCVMMVLVTLTFWAKVYAHQLRLMKHEGLLFSVREWFALVGFLFVNPGGMGGLFRPYLSYFRPSFHPWEHDTRALVEQWKAASPLWPNAPALDP
jgi:predicted metal-dependent hydrolase